MEKKLLKQIINILIDIDIGVYPKSVVNKYEKRTEYMEGWNAAVIAHAEKIIEILEDLGVDIIEDEFCEPEVIFYE